VIDDRESEVEMEEEKRYLIVDEAFKGPVRRHRRLSPSPGYHSPIGLCRITMPASGIAYCIMVLNCW
jgi:hypothetical protein